MIEAAYLMKKKTVLCIPKEVTEGNNENFSSKFLYNNDKKCLLNYQCKQKKNVNLISTMYNSPATDSTEKKKPLVIHFMITTKLVLMCFIKWPGNTQHMHQLEDGQRPFGLTF